MLERFVCPTGDLIDTSECVEKCIQAQRCMSKVSLLAIANDRAYAGKATPSMAGKGLRKIYLENTCSYTVKPTSRVYALYGSKHHALKEKVAKDMNALVEESPGTGICYYYDGEVWDYKLVGGYALKKRASYKTVKLEGVYKSGPRKGEPRVKEVFDGWNLDNMDDWVLQLNRYRLEWERAGYEVSKMFIEATVRDGGLATDRYGFSAPCQVIEVQRVNDEIVDAVYSEIEFDLNFAFDNKECPQKCSDEERWGGRLCRDYCDVWWQCLKEGGWSDAERDALVTHKEDV